MKVTNVKYYAFDTLVAISKQKQDSNLIKNHKMNINHKILNVKILWSLEYERVILYIHTICYNYVCFLHVLK